MITITGSDGSPLDESFFPMTKGFLLSVPVAFTVKKRLILSFAILPHVN